MRDRTQTRSGRLDQGRWLLQTVVLVVPAGGDLDTEGLEALAVLRAMGLPLLAALTPSALPSLQAKAAAKKHVTALLAPQVPSFPPHSEATLSTSVRNVAAASSLPRFRL